MTEEKWQCYCPGCAEDVDTFDILTEAEYENYIPCGAEEITMVYLCALCKTVLFKTSDINATMREHDLVRQLLFPISKWR